MGNLTRRDALLSTALLGMPERGLPAPLEPRPSQQVATE